MQPPAGQLGQEQVAGDHHLKRRGQPASPSMADTSPSCIWAPSVSEASSAWSAMTASKALAYSSASRSRRAPDGAAVVGEAVNGGRRAGHGAQLGQLGPALAEGDRPDREQVDQADLAALAATISTTPALSATGSVLGIGQTAV